MKRCEKTLSYYWELYRAYVRIPMRFGSFVSICLHKILQVPFKGLGSLGFGDFGVHGV